MIADNVLSESYVSTVPPGVSRMVSKAPSVIRAKGIITGDNAAMGKFIPAKPVTEFMPEANYIIRKNTVVLPSTKLSSDISLVKFLSGSGNKVTLNHITDDEERRKVARNLQQQIMATISFRNNLQFMNYRLIVIEGLYKAGAGEDLSDFATLATKGQSVVYQVINSLGKIDMDKTFEVAEYWKNSLSYDKLILDYDTYNIDGSLSAQIVVVMPELPNTYTTKYARDIETKFNNTIQSNADLIEITP
jgi:hypothetical protein